MSDSMISTIWYWLNALLIMLGRHRNIIPEAEDLGDFADDDEKREAADLAVLAEAGIATYPDPVKLSSAPGVTPLVAVMNAPVDPFRDLPLYIDHEGWLVGPNVRRVPTKRIQRLATKGARPAGIVWHWTATKIGTVQAMVNRIRELPKAGERSHSCAIWIEGDGTIYQCAPLNVGTWNAGGASAARFKFDAKDNRWEVSAKGVSANSLFVGVELCNVGEVRRTDGGKGDDIFASGAVWRGYPYARKNPETGKTELGPQVAPKDIVKGRDYEGRIRYYRKYTDAQVKAAEDLVRAMVVKYGTTRFEASWGHYLIDPSRKPDPGPDWYSNHLPQILDRVGLTGEDHS